MPHQCVRCGDMYEDGSKDLLTGCSCGSRFFFFIKKSEIKRSKEISSKLTLSERKQIEKDVEELVGNRMDSSEPVFLDIESIRVLKPGKYELDLIDLFKKEPLVYKLADGKYVIDIVSTFESMKK